MRLSQLNNRSLKLILAAYDKCAQGQAQKQAIKLEEVLGELKTKGHFSRIVGSRLCEHSKLELSADLGRRDPEVEIDFIPNLATFPEGDQMNRIRQIRSRFLEELAPLGGRQAGPRPAPSSDAAPGRRPSSTGRSRGRRRSSRPRRPRGSGEGNEG
ncbi:MAG: hypothetical protein KC609_17380 [Myxococcales bacterium]|nr:hypothetical protein [Myxococcales bacterium]